MARVGIWDLQGTENQQNIVRSALAVCDYPFETPEMVAKIRAIAGRDYIPVEWRDLSRFAEAQAAAAADVEEHGHEHAHNHNETEDEFDFLAARGRVLGLAWYSLKISLDLSLENDPRLAIEVFLSEAAHMIDFTVLTDPQREAIWDIHHQGQDDIGGHGHGWFDVGGYRDFVGESLMGDIITGYAPSVAVTIPFTHQSTRAKGLAIRKILTPNIDAPPAPPTPVPPPDEPPAPPPAPARPVFGSRKGKTFHDAHKGVPVDVTWESYDAAMAAGRRPCKICKPSATP